MNSFFNIHPWTGTQHCLREINEEDPEDHGCVNDHTGCIYNNGHNTCMCHVTPKKDKLYDSPLLKRK